jgi:hypothetical protein
MRWPRRAMALLRRSLNACNASAGPMRMEPNRSGTPCAPVDNPLFRNGMAIGGSQPPLSALAHAAAPQTVQTQPLADRKHLT